MSEKPQVKGKIKSILNFLRMLITNSERIKFFAYIKEQNIQNVSFEELIHHYDRPEELKSFLRTMIKLSLLDEQIIDQVSYFSYNPKDPDYEELLERFYKNYVTAKNIFYIKAEKDFYEKSSDIRKDKEILDSQVEDLAIFTKIGEEVQKIHKLDELFKKVPQYCIDLLGFDSAEFYIIKDDMPALVSANYRDGSHAKLNIDQFNEELSKDKVHVKEFVQSEREIAPHVVKATYSKNKEMKSEAIICKIVEEGKTTGYLEVGYGQQHKRIVDRDTNRVSVFTSTVSIALSTVRLFDELEKKVQERTEELNKMNRTLQQNIGKLEEINKEMKRELTVAANIQSGIIPKKFPKYPNIRLGAIWQSMTEVSGDYYDIIPITAAKKIGFLVVDVSGHGVPAALITTMAKVSFSAHSQTEESTAVICKQANKEIYDSIGDIGFYLTAFYGIFDARYNLLQFTNAGHQMALWQHAKDGRLEEVTSEGFFIGSIEEAEYGYNSIVLEKGDKVMFFTDGIVEARNPEGDFYEEERLHSFFTRNKDLPADEFTRLLFEEVEKFCNGRPPNDDRTVLLIECTGDPIGEEIENFPNLYSIDE